MDIDFTVFGKQQKQSKNKDKKQQHKENQNINGSGQVSRPRQWLSILQFVLHGQKNGLCVLQMSIYECKHQQFL